MRTVILLAAALAGISDALQTETTANKTTFEIVKSRKNYPDARKDCQSRGGDLFWTYNSETEATIKRAGFENRYIWIGIDDLKNEGDWRWTNGSSFSKNK
jgi:hypothetical protein